MLVSVTSFAQIDAELQSYYDSFLSDASSRGVTLDLSYSLNIQFVNHNRHVYPGISRINHDTKSAKILIKRISWDTLSVVERKILLYHELGHIILYRTHQDYSLSIMNTSAVTESVYLANEAFLLNELFIPFNIVNRHFKAPMDNSSLDIDFSTGDLVFLSKGFDYPLKPFIVDFSDRSNEVYSLGGYQLYIISIVYLNDASSYVMAKGKIFQIRAKQGNISLVQNDPSLQPNYYNGRVNFKGSTFLEYNVGSLVNFTFDDTPFKKPYSSDYISFSGQVKITDDMDKWTGKIIVLFYEKPYIQNYE